MPDDNDLDQFMLYPLVKWAAEIEYDNIPGPVLEQARMSLLDTIGCIIAGYSHPDSQNALATETALGVLGSGAGQGATVAVSGERLSVPAAAKLNSCFANVLELDDNTGGHASLVAVPVALAAGEANHVSGRELLASMVASYEIIGRTINSVFSTLKPTNEAGALPIAAPNTMAAAVQAAKLGGQDARGAFDALNVALTFKPFSPMVNVKIGSQIKPLLYGGWPVYAGMFAAAYAANGLTAADDSYESDYGGYLRSIADSWDANILTKGLGQTWQLDAPDRKRHACCGYIHASIDGIWDVLQEQNISPTDITRIEVDLEPFAHGMVGTPLLGDLTPRGAQFYLPYILATALLRDRPILPADTQAETVAANLRDSTFVALMESITVSPDPDIKERYRFSCRLHITTRSGFKVTKFIQDAVGRGARQFTPEDIEEKFRTLAATEFDTSRADQIIDKIKNLHEVEDVAELTRLLTH